LNSNCSKKPIKKIMSMAHAKAIINPFISIDGASSFIDYSILLIGFGGWLVALAA
jgi:hypothetical protein